MEDETLVQLLAEKVAYQAAFRASVLVLKDLSSLAAPGPERDASVSRSRDILSLMRGEFLSLLPGFRDDLVDQSSRHLRSTLAELLSHIEEVLTRL